MDSKIHASKLLVRELSGSARVRIRGNETLFSAKFKARDALKDDRALRKFTFTGPLQINEQVVTHGECVSADEAFDEAIFLERRIKTPCRRLMESLIFSQALSRSWQMLVFLIVNYNLCTRNSTPMACMVYLHWRQQQHSLVAINRIPQE